MCVWAYICFDITNRKEEREQYSLMWNSGLRRGRRAAVQEVFFSPPAVSISKLKSKPYSKLPEGSGIINRSLRSFLNDMEWMPLSFPLSSPKVELENDSPRRDMWSVLMAANENASCCFTLSWTPALLPPPHSHSGSSFMLYFRLTVWIMIIMSCTPVVSFIWELQSCFTNVSSIRVHSAMY